MNHPVAPVKMYVAVWAALIALTITTVAVSKLDLGEFNFVAAMTIAVVKGSLVVWFFMNLRQGSALTRLVAGAGLFWMAILIVFVLCDYFSRGWTPRPTWLN